MSGNLNIQIEGGKGLIAKEQYAKLIILPKYLLKHSNDNIESNKEKHVKKSPFLFSFSEINMYQQSGATKMTINDHALSMEQLPYKSFGGMYPFST